MNISHKNLYIVSPAVVHCLPLRDLDGHLLEVFYVFSSCVSIN